MEFHSSLSKWHQVATVPPTFRQLNGRVEVPTVAINLAAYAAQRDRDVAQAWARIICVPDRLSTAAVPPTGRPKRKLVGRSEKVIRKGLIVQSSG
jgi:hypothetical protein